MSCFGNLPVELYYETVIIVASAALENHKTWLCAMSTTSRRTLSLVQPILCKTVCITARNLPHFLAASVPGHFVHTRYLFIGVGTRYLEYSRIAKLFPNVHHFAAGLAFLDRTGRRRAVPALRATRLTLRMSLFRDDWVLLSLYPALRHITHLRLPVQSRYHVPQLEMGMLHREMALQYVVLDLSPHMQDHNALLGSLLPFFLSGIKVQRVLVCTTSEPDLRAALNNYARAHGERRIWMLSPSLSATDLRHLELYQPGVTFDAEQWTAGIPVYTAD